MGMLRIEGGARLSGVARVESAKNAVLPILAAALMASGEVTVRACPRLTDVQNMLGILETIGCAWERRGEDVVLKPDGASNPEMPEGLSKLLRSSIFLLGPILARFGKATATYPGGCEIGLRPIDLHLKGLRALGVSIREEHGMIYCDGSRLRGGEFELDFPSVGATENVMMAAALAKGETVIHNAAREPEIRDLAGFLNAMGACVRGAGTGRIRVRGVESLTGVSYTPIPDRIEAGTLLAAAAITGGEVELLGARLGDMRGIVDKLRQTGCEVSKSEKGISLIAPQRLKSVDIVTQPHPGFPTDMQAQMTALACTAEGTSVIVENLFENRFGHAAELKRMGADIQVHHRTAIVRGGRLYGARVQAGDLRGGAALALAGLRAQGFTDVEGVEKIDRGYVRLEEKLCKLGAKIHRLQ